ncbi:hypothetical protein [Ruegeria sp. HKCCA5929]|uniref:hypothetical protein n=1 Tax=Ruegeria sp. HKCCA5929 TaxID=2682988 RepID=UPI001488F342|nr:hypothetical protein [Ruegeria sp. HKCCA5929]
MSRVLIDWNDLEASVKRHLEDRPGWVPLVVEALEKIKEHAELVGDELPDITTIKQEMGSLMIYNGGCADQYVYDALERAQLKSEFTCEFCGSSARIQDFYGYLACRCPWCAHDLIEERKEENSPERYILNQRLPESEKDLCCTECGYFGQRVRAWRETRCPVCVMNAWDRTMSSNLISISSGMIQDTGKAETDVVQYQVVYGHDFVMRNEEFQVTGHMRTDDLLERCAQEVRSAIEAG